VNRTFVEKIEALDSFVSPIDLTIDVLLISSIDPPNWNRTDIVMAIVTEAGIINPEGSIQPRPIINTIGEMKMNNDEGDFINLLNNKLK